LTAAIPFRRLIEPYFESELSYASSTGIRLGQDKPIDAHAWLDAAGVEVTGYPVANTFAEIACFV
jgi:hypothetical protein